MPLSGDNVQRHLGGEFVHAMALGQPAELTAVYNSEYGYTAKFLSMLGLTPEDPGYGQTWSRNIVAIDGSTTLPVGTRGLCYPTDGRTRWVFLAAGSGAGTAPQNVTTTNEPVNGEPATQYIISTGTDPATSTQYIIQVADNADGLGNPGTQFFIQDPGGEPIEVWTQYTTDGTTATVESPAGTQFIYQGDVTFNGTVDLSGATVTGAAGSWALLATKTHADLTDADQQQDVTYYTVPAKTAIMGLIVRTKTVGSGGGVATLTLTPLVNGSIAGSQTGNGLGADNIDCRFYPSIDGLASYQVWSWGSTTTLGVRFDCDGGTTLAALTGGEWEMYALLMTLP